MANLLHLIDISEAWQKRLRGIAPDLEFTRGHRNDANFPDLLKSADIVLGSVKIAAREEAPNLKWIQLPHAGAEGWQSTPEGIRISTGAGVYGIPIAEHLFALMLGLTRGIHSAVHAMPSAHWKHPANSLEVHGATAAVIGFGDIGQHFARRAHAFGMRAIAVKRTLSDKPGYLDEMHTIDELDAVLPRADHVVISLPGTSHTRHLFDARRLGLMKESAFIYNVGRGSVIDESALAAALSSNQIAGAGLDVFEKEPLPAESPLWNMPNVIITPHRSGSSPMRDERVLELFADNLQRLLAQKPLRSEFKPNWGY